MAINTIITGIDWKAILALGSDQVQQIVTKTKYDQRYQYGSFNTPKLFSLNPTNHRVLNPIAQLKLDTKKRGSLPYIKNL